MKKIFALLVLNVIFLLGCSSYNSFLGYILGSKKTKMKREIKNIQKTTQVDSLKNIISNYQTQTAEQQEKLDSLFDIVENLEDSVDFLNSYARIKNNSTFPDSIIFAGFKFDLHNNRYLEKFKKWYDLEIKYAYKYIPRTTKYFPIIKSILKEYGLPEDLTYMAVAESYLSPFAGSSVGAVGYWQFMKSTAKYYNLTINHFVDQRQSIFSSTRAACEYILWAQKSLRNIGANDLLLALCAFNAGLGNIKRVIREQGGDDFFSLIQRKDETDEYIWRTLAIKYIIENENNIFTKPFEKEANLLAENKKVQLSLNGYYKIDNWARAQGTVVRKVWELNPWIKIYKRKQYRYSAINDVVISPGNYTVLIPKNSVPDDSRLAEIERKFQQKNSGYFVEHTVRRGENLYNISRKYNTTVTKLMRINGLNSTIIHPGQKLRLFSNSANFSTSSNYYIVKKGDTITGIASKLGISESNIISKNNLRVNDNNGNKIIYIYPGQKLFY